MKAISTIIFDAYETIATNSVEQWRSSFGEICQRLHFHIDPIVLWKTWKDFEIKFRESRIGGVKERNNATFKSYRKAWHDCFVESFGVHNLDGDPHCATNLLIKDMSERELYEDVPTGLLRIGKMWRTAILSNADDEFLLPMLESNSLNFEAVVSSEKAKSYKPALSIFFKMLDTLNVEASECVYVGDDPYADMFGARRAGLNTVWINRDGRDYITDIVEPDARISSLIELPLIVESISRF